MHHYLTLTWQGENVSKKTPVRHDFYILYEKDFGGAIDINLYHCDDVNAPERWTTRLISLCRLRFKLDIPFSELPNFKTTNGSIIKRLNYKLEMIPSGASMDFVVYIGERKMDSQNAEVQFE